MDNVLSKVLDILMTLPVILISLSVHELMHGYSAYLLGDPTAKMQGRLSLNPLRHIDPIGFISMIFFHVGWAKPVPINSRFFKKPKRDIAITSLAGPLSNFALAFISSFILILLFRFTAYLPNSGAYFALIVMMEYMVMINISLGVFNLIPIPPLDGSRILYAFLPYRIIYKIAPYERYIQLVLILLLARGVLSAPIAKISSFIYNAFILVAEGVIP